MKATCEHRESVGEIRPAEKLKILLEITNNLCTTLKMELLLPKIAESLFQLFSQAGSCFIVYVKEGAELLALLTRTRQYEDQDRFRADEAMIRRCLDSNEAVLFAKRWRQGLRSTMVVPLSAAEGKPFGVIQVDTQDDSRCFTEEDLRLFLGVANQVSIGLENARIHEAINSKNRGPGAV